MRSKEIIGPSPRIAFRHRLEELQLSEVAPSPFEVDLDAGKNLYPQLRRVRRRQEMEAKERNFRNKVLDFRRRVAKTRPLSA